MAKRGGFDYGSVGPLFNDLMERGFSPTHAAAIAGNFAHESGPRGKIDYGINEMKPTVKGSRGGFGAAQWTGPRRVGLEKFAKENNLPVGDRDTQMQYFDRERTGSEKAAFDRLQKAGDVNTATKSFMQGYERPRASTANLHGRQEHARNILAAYQRGDYKQPAGPPMPKDGATQVAQAKPAPQAPKGPQMVGPKEAARVLANNPDEQRVAQSREQFAKDFNAGNQQVAQAKAPEAPTPPSRPAGLGAEKQMANVDMRGFGQGIPQSGMQAPGIGRQLDPMRGATEIGMSNAPTPPSRPAGLGAQQPQLAEAPMPPQRPADLGAPAPVQIAQSAPPMSRAPAPVLSEPAAVSPIHSGLSTPSGMSHGMAAQAAAQMPMALDESGFGDLGGLFADAFQPDPTMLAGDMSAGDPFGGSFDMAGGDMGGGFDLGSIFGGLFG